MSWPLILAAISFTDAYLTNIIGEEANPILVPYLGWKLYVAKLLTLPFFAILAYYYDKNKVARFGTYILLVLYGLVVLAELTAIGLYR